MQSTRHWHAWPFHRRSKIESVMSLRALRMTEVCNFWHEFKQVTVLLVSWCD